MGNTIQTLTGSNLPESTDTVLTSVRKNHTESAIIKTNPIEPNLPEVAKSQSWPSTFKQERKVYFSMNLAQTSREPHTTIESVLPETGYTRVSKIEPNVVKIKQSNLSILSGITTARFNFIEPTGPTEKQAELSPNNVAEINEQNETCIFVEYKRGNVLSSEMQTAVPATATVNSDSIKSKTSHYDSITSNKKLTEPISTKSTEIELSYINYGQNESVFVKEPRSQSTKVPTAKMQSGISVRTMVEVYSAKSISSRVKYTEQIPSNLTEKELLSVSLRQSESLVLKADKSSKFSGTTSQIGTETDTEKPVMSKPDLNSTEVNPESTIEVNKTDTKNEVDVNNKPYEIKDPKSSNSFSDSGLSRRDSSTTTIKKTVAEYLEMRESFENITNYPGVERSQYEFTSERNNMLATNTWTSVMHMVKAIVGVGILSMHEAYKNGGILTSVLTSIFVGSIAHYNTLVSLLWTLERLVKLAHIMCRTLRVPMLTYPLVMETAAAIGPKWLRKYRTHLRHIVNTLLFAECIFICNIYQILVGETLKKILESSSNKLSKLNLSVRVYIGIMTIPLLVICLIKKMKYTAPFSVLTDVTLVFAICLVLYYSIIGIDTNLSHRPDSKDMPGIFGFTGIFIFSIDGVIIALPIENNMKRPYFFPTVAWFAFLLVILLASAVGFFGFWSWGEKCSSSAIMHLPQTTIIIIFYWIFLVAVAISFSMKFWTTFRLVWRYVRKKLKRRRGVIQFAVRVMLIFLITFISQLYPKLNRFMCLIGNCMMGCLTFIFPPLIDCLVTHDFPSKLRRFINVISFLLGVTVIFGGLMFNILK